MTNKIQENASRQPPMLIDRATNFNVVGGIVRLDLACLMIGQNGQADHQPQCQLALSVPAFCNLTAQLHQQALKLAENGGFPYPPANNPPAQSALNQNVNTSEAGTKNPASQPVDRQHTQEKPAQEEPKGETLTKNADLGQSGVSKNWFT